MYNHSVTKGKDQSPLQTVKKVKDILQGLEILAEEHWTNLMEGFYSVTICIFGTDLAVKGKGTTPDAALASGYGELMERLQNFYLNNINMDTYGDIRQYAGYCFSPDEKHLGIAEILECKDTWAAVFTLKAQTREEKTGILKEWLDDGAFDKPSDFISLPFINIKDGRMHYLPKTMLYVLYGSNGMCSGNTPEEALVRGLSEVMETHARKMVMEKGLNPPQIPDSYIGQYQHIFKMIKKIEKLGPYKIIIKDCSLGVGLPVVAAIFADLQNQAFFVSFGAHPVFEIALEKCLIDIMEEKNFKNTDRMCKFSYFSSSIFMGKCSYAFEGFSGVKTYDNKSMLDFLYVLLMEKGYDVLIRDVSFLGFPSFQIIVPSFSEVKDPCMAELKAYSASMRVRRMSEDLGNCNDEELQELAEYVLSGNGIYTGGNSIVNVQDIPPTGNSIQYGINWDWFAAVSCYRLGLFKKACELFDKYICYIPDIMLQMFYGSNGMCAGNTREEALVQGISEIMERYAKIRIIRERLTPPTIPDEYLKRFPSVCWMIENIEKKGNYRVNVKDCSLGEGLPVVGIILSDLNINSYMVVLGAHPVFEIALERCLTEALQGRRLDDKSWMAEFSYLDKKVDLSRNILSLLITGEGSFPLEFFGENSSYMFSEPESCAEFGNNEMLGLLIRKLSERNREIYVRDVSFLGFPSFQIIIEGMSECFGSIKTVEDLENRCCGVDRTARRLNEATDSELETLIDYLYETFTPQSTFADILRSTMVNAPVKISFPWSGIRRDLLISGIYYRLGNLRQAYGAMDKFISDQGNTDSGISYYKCVRDYIGARLDNMDDISTRVTLGAIYPEELVDRVISGMSDYSGVLKSYPVLDCYYCESCKYSEYCYFPSVRSLYEKLKDCYAKNVIDQKDNLFLADMYNNRNAKAV